MGNSVRRYLAYGYGLVQGHVPFGPPVLSCDNVREAKCTRLGYGTGLYTLNPPLALSFLRIGYSATPDPEQENNQRTLDKSQVPQADPSVKRLHKSN
jgi:hypothetical protein